MIEKKILIFSFCFLIANILFSQDRVIKIIDANSNKEIVIKENKRVRVKTINGERISGKLKIINNETIEVKNTLIKLSNISKIKRNPLLQSVIINGGLCVLGATGVMVSVFSAAIVGKSSLLLWSVPASGLIFTGIKSPNILKGYQKDRGWDYQIITMSN